MIGNNPGKKPVLIETLLKLSSGASFQNKGPLGRSSKSIQEGWEGRNPVF